MAGICGQGLYDIDQVPVHCDCAEAIHGHPINQITQIPENRTRLFRYNIIYGEFGAIKSAR